jgi:asparagine synthase (glutamine-hydrolysing)
VGFDRAAVPVSLMNARLVHRGPDSEGSLDSGRIALGIRRLRIIDLNTGDQPIYSHDRRRAVVLNGEIYNFRSLRTELEALGHRFATRSDTEVVLQAYEEWGLECLPRLRGMFAFAIYDRGIGQETGSLLLARDRLGIKPLYLWHDNQQLLFASEVRALLASGSIPRVLSAAGLYTYLAFGSVQEPLTMIDGVTSLPPGSWLHVAPGPDGLQIKSGEYWHPPAVDDRAHPEPDEVYRWLADAVSSHLISDVPLGAFLSGGLDSGAVVALGSEALGGPLCAFTLGFDGWAGDEREQAALTAQRWASHHQVRTLGSDDVLADLGEALAAMDQPTVDGINTWYVSREARRAGLTVALSGLGGDELFAGYVSFRVVPRLRRIQHLLPRALQGLPSEGLLSRLLQPARGLHKLSGLLSEDLFFDHPYFLVRSLLAPHQVRGLLHPDVLERLSGDDAALELWRQHVDAQIRVAETYDPVGAVSWLELSQYMRSTLMRDADAMSMAHSLEVRVPFVDHVLVEHVLPLGGERKLGRHPKPLLVDALGDRLPPSIVARKKKTFTLPFEKWLREDLAALVGNTLIDLPEQLLPWVEAGGARRLWAQFEQGSTTWSRPWTLFVLAKWVQRYL